MQLDISTISIWEIISMSIAFGALIFSYLRASAALKQANLASESLSRLTLSCLFTTFNQASQICVDDPEIFYSVDGLDKTIPPEEAKNIAYFGLLMDGFQQFYGQMYHENFNKMLKELKTKTTYLNNLISIEENQKRWEKIKPLYYGSFDEQFVKAIDELIQHTRSKK